MPGTLYLVPTPIGNLGDISARMADTLAQADFIAAEDTRVTLQLLNHLGLQTPMVSYYRQQDIPVVSIPGPCALITALAASGLPTGRFTFEGFLAMNKKNRRAHLEELKREKRTMLFYEAPHKLLATLTGLRDTLGPDRRIALCRELTKLHEEIRRTTLGNAVAWYEETPPKGEFVLVVEGGAPEAENVPTLETGLLRVESLRNDGTSLRDAARQAAAELGLSRKTLYDLALGKRTSDNVD